MKKLLSLCLTAIICLCCLASCGSAYKENTWFSDEKLAECLVGDLPTVEKDYVNSCGEDIYVSFTDKEREAYVAEVFEYLKSQNFKYLGTRGEQASTLAGSFTTYYFKPATELSEFYVDSSYKFVYSDGTLDEGGDPIFCILTIYDYEAKNLEYGTKNFAYNTLITLRYKQEAPFSGRYALNKEVHEHIITYVSAGVSGHFENYECGCSHDHGAVLHYDENFDCICDACGYDMNEDYPPIVDETISLRNLTGCSWLNDITAEDIAEIKIISEAVGVAHGNLKNIWGSTDEAVIARIFEEYYSLETRPISKMDGQIDGGSGVTVKFILKDGMAKELYINNGNYRDTNGDYFELNSVPKFKDTDNAVKAYGFITYIGTGTVYDKDNNPMCEIPIDELEFHYDLDLDLPDLPPYDMVIKTEFGDLEFIARDIFYMETGEACVLVGKNLDELIAQYNTNSKSHSISYQSDRTEELLMEDFAPTSAKPGDTVVLRTYPLMDADLAFYANGVKLTQTYADYDYWEYVFTMPDHDVVITHEITDGFLPD